MVTKAAILVAVLALAVCAAPQRIVSTAPNITEILYALGLGDRVVGVTTYCHYPPEVRNKPKIGPFIRPDLEAIVALRPDLVIIQKNPIQLYPRLKGVGQNVLEIDHDTVANIYLSIEQIAAAAGVVERGRALRSRIESELENIRRRTSRFPPRKVLFVVGRTTNTIEGIVAVGGASYLNDLLSTAGGKNILADSMAAYPKVPTEEILARNPEVVIDMGDMTDTDAASHERQRVVVALWNRYPMLKAVRERRVYAVASDIYVVPGPRIVDAAREFARMLHPEAGL
jgi:iron complex transport system substrate-binding protein